MMTWMYLNISKLTHVGHLASGSCVRHLDLGLAATAGCSCCPTRPRVAFKREFSFSVAEIPQKGLQIPPFPRVTRSWRAKLSDWCLAGPGKSESKRVISSAIC